VGSCTNSSYKDLSKVASLVKQAQEAGLKPKTNSFVSTGSEQIRATVERDGILDILRGAEATVLSSSCGPCVGQWERMDVPKVGSISLFLFLFLFLESTLMHCRERRIPSSANVPPCVARNPPCREKR
jgi:homoaconitase